MAVMDEFKEERAALKNAGFKKKLSYFWDYYKWYVIGTIAVVAFVSSFIYEYATKKETALYAVLLNASPLTKDSSEYTQSFADYTALDTEEYELFFDTSIRIEDGSMDDVTYTSVQKLAVYTAAADLDVMVSDATSFQKYANSYTFYDLREILTPEQIEKYEPYFYYVDTVTVEKIEAANDALDTDFVPVYPDPYKPEEMTTPIPVGITVDGNEWLQENFYFRGEDITLGVYCNTQRLDMALQYIDFLMQEGN